MINMGGCAESNPEIIKDLIKRVAFIYLSLAPSAVGRRAIKEKFILRRRLGLEYLCATLKNKNIETKIYDQVLLDFSLEKLVSFLKRDKIDLVGFYIISKNLNIVKCYIKEIKKKVNIPVISGGPGCNHYNELIDAGCEIVCLGEGDETIVEIVDYYEGRESLREIKGIAYFDTETKKILTTLARPLISNLDNLPFPHRDPKMIQKYCDYFAYPLKRPYITIITSRGCPHNCSFCTSHSFWKRKYRQRSVENVIQEIKQAVHELNIKSIYFVDDIFALDFNWLTEFCQAVKKEKFNFTWMCNLHPMTFRKTREKAFSLMKESGCSIISFGAQSADAEILKRVNRDPGEPGELRKAICQANSTGITTAVTYIFGLPGETVKTLQKNIDFCLEAKPHIVDFHLLEIIPFSDLSIHYSQGRVCELGEDQLAYYNMKYMMSYYLRPKIAFQLLRDILNKNPARILTFSRLGFHFLKILLASPGSLLSGQSKQR
ncbi:MAG: B12-binding domain-containing radical SAM protein [Candidatus Omnitrophica bacterium]|nr:B12-binding domain-containing radical SAM protein [Candidatus Omnitrophota bacterium]